MKSRIHFSNTSEVLTQHTGMSEMGISVSRRLARMRHIG
jgi:hypothetical protein